MIIVEFLCKNQAASISGKHVTYINSLLVIHMFILYIKHELGEGSLSLWILY
jgi:hypothetical protein